MSTELPRSILAIKKISGVFHPFPLALSLSRSGTTRDDRGRARMGLTIVDQQRFNRRQDIHEDDLLHHRMNQTICLRR